MNTNESLLFARASLPTNSLQLATEEAQYEYDRFPGDNTIMDLANALQAEVDELRQLQVMAANAVQRMERTVDALSHAYGKQSVELVLLKAGE